jgi:hypothetical protein
VEEWFEWNSASLASMRPSSNLSTAKKKKDNTHAIISVSRFPAYMGDQEGCSAEIKKTKEEISNFST